MPVVGERALGPDELRAAGRLEDALATIWRRPIVLGGVLALICVSLVIATGEPVAAAPVAVLLAVLFDRRVREAGQFAAMLQRDLMGGVVQVCRGAVKDLMPVISVTKLRARRFDDPAAAIELEVLPESQLVWTIDGKAVDDVLYVAGSTTASVPAQAMAAANYVKEVGEGASVLTHQRALTPEELRELDGCAPAVHPALIVLAVVAVSGAIATFMLAMAGGLTSLLAPIAFAVIGWLSGTRVVTRLRARRRISHDLAVGYVVIVRVRLENGELTAPEEVLPHSGIRWTEGGAPSPWRRMH